MAEMDIDLERVISDPAYRRTVLDYLKNEADGKADVRFTAANTVDEPLKMDASAK
jgi:hypothetical protein